MRENETAGTQLTEIDDIEILQRLEKEEEDPEIKNAVKEILGGWKEGYANLERDRSDGPLRIGKGLQLREDFYATAWLSMLHIEVITGKPKLKYKKKDKTEKE